MKIGLTKENVKNSYSISGASISSKLMLSKATLAIKKWYRQSIKKWLPQYANLDAPETIIWCLIWDDRSFIILYTIWSDIIM